MSFPSNRPSIDRLIRQVRVSSLGAAAPQGLDMADADPDLLADLLDASVYYVEDAARTRFNGALHHEVRDGNATNGLELFRWPIGQVRQVRVELPVLALSRVYTSSEVKVYRFQGRITIFTYKLAAEQASLHLDQLINGNILPPLPQCVFIDYTYGFPQYDPDLDLTTWDGGLTSEAGDTRDELDRRHLNQLQTAAVCDAAASFLAQAAGLGVGLVQSVSFDGLSKTLNPQAYGPQIDALISRRDELLGRNRTGFHLASVGG